MQRTTVLAVAYLIAAACVMVTYWFGFTDNIVIHTCLFLLVIAINRLSFDYSRFSNNAVRYILYGTELCFGIYVLLALIYGSDYFTQYKLLIVPAVLLSIYQAFGLKKVTGLEA